MQEASRYIGEILDDAGIYLQHPSSYDSAVPYVYGFIGKSRTETITRQIFQAGISDSVIDFGFFEVLVTFGAK